MLSTEQMQTCAPLLAQYASPWDCHIHVFGPRRQYPLHSAARYRPAIASVSDLRAHAARIGAAHVVLVQASPYGTDNSCLLHALSELSATHRAVVSLDIEAITEKRIADLNARGVRAVRVNPPVSLTVQEVVTLCQGVSRRIAGSPWHLEVHCGTHVAVRVAERCSAHTRIVFDHLAGLRPRALEFFTDLARLPDILGEANWVKVSGLDRVRHSEADNDRIAQVIADLRRLAPDRLVWGSDWPHTPMKDGDASFRAVDTRSELPWILRQLGDDARRVLETNPADLYR